jgi:hypothetical protein
MSRCEHSAAKHHIGWLIPQIEPVDCGPGEQEHLLCLPVHHCPGGFVPCCCDAKQHRDQFMKPAARHFTEVQRRRHFHNCCRAEVLYNRLA